MKKLKPGNGAETDEGRKSGPLKLRQPEKAFEKVTFKLRPE